MVPIWNRTLKPAQFGVRFESPLRRTVIGTDRLQFTGLTDAGNFLVEGISGVALALLFFAQHFQRSLGIVNCARVGVPLTVAAERIHFPAERSLGGIVGMLVHREVCGVSLLDIHSSRCGERILVGTEEEKLPWVFLRLMADSLCDAFPCLSGACS